MSALPLDNLFFIHIPKCAGSTLGALMTTSYTPEAFLGSTDYYAETLLGLPLDRIEQAKLVAGHNPNWVYRLRFNHMRRMLVLRNPATRFESFMRHGYNEPAFRGGHEGLFETKDILSYFDTPENLYEWVGGNSYASYTVSSTLGHYPTQNNIVPDQYWQESMDEVKAMEIVITEKDYDTYYKSFAFDLMMPPLKDTPKARQSSNYKKKDNAHDFEIDHDRLRDYMPGDFEVYDHACTVSSQNAPEEPRYGRWKRLYDQYWSNQDRKDTYIFNPARPYKGYGWYPRKITILPDSFYKGGMVMPFDNSGAFLDLPLTKKMTRISGLFAARKEILSQVELKVNGQIVPINWRSRIVKDYCFFDAFIGEDHIADPYTRLEFGINVASMEHHSIALCELTVS